MSEDCIYPEVSTRNEEDAWFFSTNVRVQDEDGTWYKIPFKQSYKSGDTTDIVKYLSLFHKEVYLISHTHQIRPEGKVLHKNLIDKDDQHTETERLKFDYGDYFFRSMDEWWDYATAKKYK